MKKFSVGDRGPKEFVDGVNDKLSGGSLGEIASVDLEGDTLAVRFSQMGTTELFYAVTEQGGGFTAELAEERVAPFHAPFRAEFEKKFAEIMTDLGADVES